MAEKQLGTAPSGATDAATKGYVDSAVTGVYRRPSGGIPEADLATALQAKIDGAVGAYIKPGTGIPASDLAASVQAELGTPGPEGPQGPSSVVAHGTVASTARPSTTSTIIWVGSVQPTNAVNGDIWLDNSGTAPTISTTALNSLYLGIAADQFLVVSGTQPVVWSSTGTLPAGLSLSSAGELSGVPTTSGSYSFAVSATNGYGSATQTYTGTVGPAVAPVIITAAITTPQVNAGYSQPLNASGSAPITWTLQSGSSLPAGLNLVSNLGPTLGGISGTPTTPGSFSFTVVATNSAGSTTQTYTGAVAGVAPTITTTSLGSMSQGAAFSQTPTSTGGPTSWAYSGTLPAGLALNTFTGQIYGTPTGSGPYSFSLTATNSYGSSTAQPYSGTIASSAPVITSTTLNTVYSGASFSQQFTATGATPITWSVSSGSLPPGLTLSGSGLLAGTPTATSSTFSFVVQASNGFPPNATLPFTSVPVVPAVPVITTTTLAGARQGTNGTWSLATTGQPTITWALQPGSTLPSGLSLDTTHGIISGQPASSGSYSFNIIPTSTAAGAGSAYTISGTIAPLGVTFNTKNSYTNSPTGTGTADNHPSVTISTLNNDYVLVALGTYSDAGSPTTVTFTPSGGSPITMTQLGSINHSNLASYGSLKVFGAFSTAAGTGTVTAALTNTSLYTVVALAYTGVNASTPVTYVTTLNTGSYTTISQTANNGVSNGQTVQFFSGYNQAFTATSGGTQRALAGIDGSIAVVDNSSTTSMTFGGTCGFTGTSAMNLVLNP